MAIEHNARDSDEGRRVEYVLAELFEELPSPSRARKMLRRERVQVNGRIVGSGWILQPGDLLRYDPPPPPDRRVLELDVDVLFEDEHMAIVNKPAGIATSGSRFRTLNQCLPHNLQPSGLPDKLGWPRAVHRLDVRTEGVLVVAKAGEAEVGLCRAFQHRRVHKRYRALLVGRLEGTGSVDSPIDERDALSHYAIARHDPSKHIGWITTAWLEPHTGRTHQLRRHMAALGHPVVGDDLHTGEVDNILRKGLYLQACEISLEHPVTGEPLHVGLPTPRKFERLRDWERGGWWDTPAARPITAVSAD